MDKLSAPQIGKAGELRVASELILRGFNPAIFYFDNGTDIILSNGKKIGVKTVLKPLYDKKGYSWKYSFSVRAQQFRIDKEGIYKRKYTKRDYQGYVDYWICWCVQDNLFYIIPQKEIGQKVSIVIPTPIDKRIYQKHTWKKSQSKYEKYRNNWNILK